MIYFFERWIIDIFSKTLCDFVSITLTFCFDAGTKVRTERQDIKLNRNVAYETPKPCYNMTKNVAYEAAPLRA